MYNYSKKQLDNSVKEKQKQKTMTRVSRRGRRKKKAKTTRMNKAISMCDGCCTSVIDGWANDASIIDPQ